jgi:hypothetical protein
VAHRSAFARHDISRENTGSLAMIFWKNGSFLTLSRILYLYFFARHDISRENTGSLAMIFWKNGSFLTLSRILYLYFTEYRIGV